jgi:hypothetical protein
METSAVREFMAHPIFSQEETDTYECLLPGKVKANETGFGKIYIHLESGLVSFHQRWRYNFTLDQTSGKTAAKASLWTDQEQVDFHYAAKSIIWKFWNSHRTLPGSTDPTVQNFVDLVNRHSGLSFSVGVLFASLTRTGVRLVGALSLFKYSHAARPQQNPTVKFREDCQN